MLRKSIEFAKNQLEEKMNNAEKKFEDIRHQIKEICDRIRKISMDYRPFCRYKDNFKILQKASKLRGTKILIN